MIKGTDKPFVQGKPFVTPEYKKSMNGRKGKACARCGRYRKLEFFRDNNEDCIKCEDK